MVASSPDEVKWSLIKPLLHDKCWTVGLNYAHSTHVAITSSHYCHVTVIGAGKRATLSVQTKGTHDTAILCTPHLHSTITATGLEEVNVTA